MPLTTSSGASCARVEQRGVLAGEAHDLERVVAARGPRARTARSARPTATPSRPSPRARGRARARRRTSCSIDRGRLLVDQDHAAPGGRRCPPPAICRRSLSLSLRRVVQVPRASTHRPRGCPRPRLAQPRRHDADGQVEVIDQRVAARARTCRCRDGARRRSSLTSSASAWRIVTPGSPRSRCRSSSSGAMRSPARHSPAADPPAQVQRDLEVHRQTARSGRRRPFPPTTLGRRVRLLALLRAGLRRGERRGALAASTGFTVQSGWPGIGGVFVP